jgi:PAS domain S-box-containing protein
MDKAGKSAAEIMEELQELRQMIEDFRSQDAPYKKLNEQLQEEIKQHKKTEDALHKEKYFAESIVQTAQAIILLLGPQGQIININPYMEMISGYKNKEVQGKDWFDTFLPKENRTQTRELFAKAAKGIRTKGNINHIITKDGSSRYIEWYDRVLKDADGKTIGVLAIGQDITKRKKAEESVARSEQLFSKVFYANPISAAIADVTDSKLLMVNDAWLKLFGFNSSDEVIGKSEVELGLWADPKDRDYRNAELQQTGSSAIHETQIRTSSGQTQSCFYSAEMIEYEGESHVLSMAIDISKRKEAEEQLLEAKTQAEAANIAKSRFLANMSHEIRTPMGVILGFSEVLTKEELTKEQTKYARLIQKSGTSLLRLIDDILDFSRIEAGKLKVLRKKCSLKALLSNIDLMMQPLAMKNNIEFAVIPDDGLPTLMNTDRDRVQQCLVNLIGNAVKFTEQGHVHLKVTAEDKNSVPFVRFEIEDTGIGIPKEKQEAIFSSFTQVDASNARKYGGAGLGLAITKQLVELLGGELSLTSEENVGSVFCLTLPVGVSAGSQPLLDTEMQETKSVSNLAGEMADKVSGKVLVAEDDNSCQILTKKMLEQMGLDVTVVENGQEAIEIVNKESFDLIFMDMQMPVVDGYQAVQALQEQGVTTPMVALTAHAMAGDEERCLEAGCNHYISKPIDQEKLLRTVKEILAAQKNNYKSYGSAEKSS